MEPKSVSGCDQKENYLQSRFVLFGKPKSEDLPLLPFDPEELAVYNNFVKLTKTDPENSLNFLKGQGPITLFILAERYPSIMQICRSDFFNNYWVDLMQKIGWVSQPKISTFELMIGLHYYIVANSLITVEKKRIEDMEKVIEEGLDKEKVPTEDLFLSEKSINLLKKSINCNCIYATKKYIEEFLFGYIRQNGVEYIIKIASKAAEIHGTPGCILCALTFLMLCKHAQEFKISGKRAKTLYEQTFVYFCRAKSLMEFSLNSIKNASHVNEISDKHYNFYVLLRLLTMEGKLNKYEDFLKQCSLPLELQNAIISSVQQEAKKLSFCFTH